MKRDFKKNVLSTKVLLLLKLINFRKNFLYINLNKLICIVMLLNQNLFLYLIHY